MRDLHAVHTPENVRFEFELAGIASRALAWAIDVCVTVALIALASTVISILGVVLAGFARAVYLVVLFALQWGYGAVLEWRWRGQTVGKRLVGLRVVSSQGMPITFGAAALRNVLRLVDLMPGAYLLGALSVLWDGKARRLGDMAADTIVVRVHYTERPGLAAAADRGRRLYAPGESALIGKATRLITAQEHDAALALTKRRDTLPLAVRYRLFADLAQHLERRLGLTRPAWLSHERFVMLAISTEDSSAAATQEAERPRLADG